MQQVKTGKKIPRLQLLPKIKHNISLEISSVLQKGTMWSYLATALYLWTFHPQQINKDFIETY